MTPQRTLTEADVDAVAQRVVEILRGTRHAPVWLTAQEVGSQFGLSAAWVREHADQLGAVRLGGGPRPRLRFDASAVREALTAFSPRKGSVPPESQTPAGCSARAGRSGQVPRTQIVDTGWLRG